MNLVKNNIRKTWWMAGFFSALLTPAVLAATGNSTVTIPDSGGGEIYSTFARYMQDLVNFLGGSGVLFAVFVSAAVAVCIWIFAPKNSGLMGWLVRIVIGAIVLFNLAVIILYFRGN